MHKTISLSAVTNSLATEPSSLPKHDLLSVSEQGLVVLKHLAFPACVLDRQGAVLGLNSAWRNLVGRDDDSQGSPWLNLIDAEDRYSALSCLQDIGAGQSATRELRLRNWLGEAHWYLVSLTQLSDTEVLCTAADIDALRRREEMHKTKATMQTSMLDISVDCIKLLTPTGLVLHMNKAGCRALGVPENSSFGMDWLDLLPDDVRAIGRQAIADASSGKVGRFAGRSSIPGKAPQYWDNSLTPVLDANGNTTAILVVSREVTAERLATQALRESEERLSMAANVGGLGIWDYDIIADTMVCDDNWYRIVGRDPSDPVRSVADFRPLIHPDDAEAATEVRHTAAELIAKGDDYRILFRIVRPSGELRWVRSAAAIQMHDDQPVRATGFIVDVTESVLREQKLQEQNQRLMVERESLARLSAQDALTGVANRRELEERLARYWLDSKTTGVPLTLVMVDVDHFKQFNDHYGHQGGDVVLKQVADALLSLTRTTDMVARYGGEEFLLALPGVVRPGFVLNRINEVVRELEIPHEFSASGVLTVSSGCAVRDMEDGSVEELIARADSALYVAKQAGRDRYVIDQRSSAQESNGTQS